MASVSILNPLDVAEWDDLLLACDCATFFHTAAWAHVLSGSYGYTPLYFTIIENGRLTGLIPAMEIDSFLTGKRGVALPFTDFCLPIAADSESFIALQDAVRAYGRKACWKSIEFRGGENFGHEPAWKSYFTHTLAVDQDENAIFKAFRGNTRRNIRHAIGAGVSVQRLESREAVAEFFRLHCITRRNHGLPPQPARFFDQIYDHIIAAGRGFVMLAWHQCRVVAGAMFFHFKDHAITSLGRRIGIVSVCGQTTWSCGSPFAGAARMASAAFFSVAPSPATRGFCSSNAPGAQMKIGWNTASSISGQRRSLQKNHALGRSTLFSG